MTRVCTIFLMFLAAAAVSGCIVIKNPFQESGADARVPSYVAGDLSAGRGARMRAGRAQDERELLRHAVDTLARTRRIGHAASLKRTPGERVTFDYTYFDHDLKEMIEAIREYLAAHGTGARAARAPTPLKLDYAR